MMTAAVRICRLVSFTSYAHYIYLMRCQRSTLIQLTVLQSRQEMRVNFEYQFVDVEAAN